MTEEIIIDCGWYRNGWCGCETEDKKCEQIKLCRFKVDKLRQQLQRLEQENKELKKRIKELKGSEDNFYNQAEKAHKEYYKCKKALEYIKEQIDCSKCKYQNEECFPQQCDRIQNKINEVLNDRRE